ncbi:MAG: aminotransferase class I/II-fold pyridoxal phosphate-dependent enzyme [Bacteroidetes bacterium]|nr:aminotransferase class I/II-fold pyridoxal phosphate-dependent enzyme [Bacteroidota bacterium]
MLDFEGRLSTKLPNVGTSIFAVMSKMANEHNAINLSQGFPDFPVSAELIELIHHYMKNGYNQYAPMPGVPALRAQIVKKVKDIYGAEYNADSEITVTAGATQAIYTAISAIIRDEDEAIIFEPAYDSYAPSIRLNGGTVKYARLLLPDYSIDWDELPRLITHRTKLIIINTPHNPTGSVLKSSDILQLEALTKETDIIVISDEVYEHLIFDNLQHESVCKYPELARRSFVIASFGKTFHATGWKMGYVLAPEKLMNEFRKVHQFNVFTVNTPIQYAIADFISKKKNYNKLHSFYEQKRDYFADKIRTSRFRIVPCFGTYFQLLDYRDISDKPEMEFAKELIKKFGIASIPVSSFYHDGMESKRLRFCFAKQKETLNKAAEILCKI